MSRSDLPSNSKTVKAGKDKPPRKERTKRVDAVVESGSVKQKKKSFGKKIQEDFLGDDTRSVGSYIFMDVLIPALKDLIYDMITGSAEMSLFGTSGGRRRSSKSSSKGRTSYEGYYQKEGPRDRIS